jgi:hypothetical protein
MIYRLCAYPETRDAGSIDTDTAGGISEHEVSEEVRAAEVFQDRHASEFGYFGELLAFIIRAL